MSTQLQLNISIISHTCISYNNLPLGDCNLTLTSSLRFARNGSLADRPVHSTLKIKGRIFITFNISDLL
jgi:hypothetical protein